MGIRKREGYKFSDKRHPVQGVIAIGVGLVSLIVMLTTFYISSKSAGQGGLILGLVGVLAFLISIFGIAMSVIGFQKKEIFYATPIVGIGLNGFLFVAYLILYIMGI
jgi:hypothetical protein